MFFEGGNLDVTLYTFKFLDAGDLHRLACVNKCLATLLRQRDVWLPRYNSNKLQGTFRGQLILKWSDDLADEQNILFKDIVAANRNYVVIIANYQRACLPIIFNRNTLSFYKVCEK